MSPSCGGGSASASGSAPAEVPCSLAERHLDAGGFEPADDGAAARAEFSGDVLDGPAVTVERDGALGELGLGGCHRSESYAALRTWSTSRRLS